MTIVAQAITSLDQKHSRRGSATIEDPVTTESEFNTKVTFFDDDAVEISSPYTWAEVSTELDALQAAEEATSYIQKRREAYPDVGDQLDSLFHSGVFDETMTAILQAVKDAHPKPE